MGVPNPGLQGDKSTESAQKGGKVTNSAIPDFRTSVDFYMCYFLVLAFKGIYHYWKCVDLFQGNLANRDRVLRKCKCYEITLIPDVKRASYNMAPPTFNRVQNAPKMAEEGSLWGGFRPLALEFIGALVIPFRFSLLVSLLVYRFVVLKVYPVYRSHRNRSAQTFPKTTEIIASSPRGSPRDQF